MPKRLSSGPRLAVPARFDGTRGLDAMRPRPGRVPKPCTLLPPKAAFDFGVSKRRPSKQQLRQVPALCPQRLLTARRELATAQPRSTRNRPPLSSTKQCRPPATARRTRVHLHNASRTAKPSSRKKTKKETRSSKSREGRSSTVVRLFLLRCHARRPGNSKMESTLKGCSRTWIVAAGDKKAYEEGGATKVIEGGGLCASSQ